MKPFEIKNKEHKEKVIERLWKDLRALTVYEFEDGDEEGFNISSKAYEELFGEDALESYFKDKREYLDSINEKRKENDKQILEECMGCGE